MQTYKIKNSPDVPPMLIGKKFVYSHKTSKPGYAIGSIIKSNGVKSSILISIAEDNLEESIN